jgi:hypothetical protein
VLNSSNVTRKRTCPREGALAVRSTKANRPVRIQRHAAPCTATPPGVVRWSGGHDEFAGEDPLAFPCRTRLYSFRSQ